MKKITSIAALISLIFSASATASSAQFSNENLARIACNNLEQEENIKTAISRTYIETKSVINNEQKNILKQLASGELDVATYCYSSNIINIAN